MIRLSIKQLITERIRFRLGALGISAAVALIVSMQAIFAGVSEQLSRFITHAGGDVIVAQEGVQNLYLAHSVLPSNTLGKVSQVAGVEQAVPVLMIPVTLKMGEATSSNWVVAIPEEDTGTLATPWAMKEGSKRPVGRQVVLDAALARKHSVKIGDHVEIADTAFEVVGLSNETSRLGSVMTFASLTEVRSVLGLAADETSYIFVRTEPGVVVSDVVKTLQQGVPETSVMTNREVMENDIRLSTDMGGDTLHAMTLIALAVGLISVGITVFATVSERLRDYAVLKMVGANASTLFGMVLSQALCLSAAGFLVGSLFVVVIAPIISTAPLPLPLLMVLRLSVVLWNLPMCVVVGVGSALLPWFKVYRAEPMSVFH